MGFVDDLTKASALFNQGMSRLATTSAFERAAQESEQVNREILNEAEIRNAQRDIAQGLQQDLLQAGANPTTIAQAGRAFGPSILPTAGELISEGVRFQSQQQVQTGQDIIRAQQAPLLEGRLLELGVRAQQALSKESRTQEKALSKEGRKSTISALNKFQQDNRAAFDALGSAGRALALIEKTAGQPDQQAINLATIGLLKLAGESGRLSDQDFDRARFDPSFRQQVVRRLSNELLGRTPTREREFFIDMLTVLRDETAGNLIKDAAGRAESLQGQIPGANIEDLTNRFILRIPRDAIKSFEQTKIDNGSDTAPPKSSGGINLRKFIIKGK